jgi:hypothetical protein
MALRTLDIADGFASASSPSTVDNPIQYTQDASNVYVKLDTTTPANNKGLPVSVMAKRTSDGVVKQVEMTDTGSLKVDIGSSASITVSSEVEIKNDTGNPIPVNGTVTANLGTIAGVSTEITLSAMSAKLPASLGIKTSANSMSITPASDAVFPITSGVLAGSVSTARVTVGTSAVRATVAGTAPNASRKKLVIKPNKNNTGAIYYGGSGVTTANGLEIIGPDVVTILSESTDYYLISDTAAQIVEVMEVI